MKNQLFLFSCFIVGSILIISGCAKTVEEPAVLEGYNHYPTNLGDFWEYQMDSTTYDNLGFDIKKTTSFYRESIVEVNISENNDTSYVVEASRKKNFSDDWETTDIYSIEKSTESLIKIEENLHFKKMIFPFVENVAWEGNLFDEQIAETIEGEEVQVYLNWEYKVLSLGNQEEINGRLFTNIAIIQQANDVDNLILKRTSIEKYEEGVGLVHRNMCILDSQDTESTDPWVDKAHKGFILDQTLINTNR